MNERSNCHAMGWVGLRSIRFADESGRIACAVGYAGIYLQEAIHRRPSYLRGSPAARIAPL